MSAVFFFCNDRKEAKYIVRFGGFKCIKNECRITVLPYSVVADKEVSQVNNGSFGVPSLLPPHVFEILVVSVLVIQKDDDKHIYMSVPLLAWSLSHLLPYYFVQEACDREKDIVMQ